MGTGLVPPVSTSPSPDRQSICEGRRVDGALHAFRATSLLDMCRNIRTLYNFDPPATDDEVRAAALQYVRKVSGFTKPSRANEEPFARAVDAVAEVSLQLLRELETNAPPKNREEEAAKARARAAQRYAA